MHLQLMKLFILGNGFDLHHGLQTRYSDFRDYLKEYHPDEFELIDSCLCDPEDNYALWSELEDTLGRTAVIDVKSVYDEIRQQFGDGDEDKQRAIVLSEIERLSKPR